MVLTLISNNAMSAEFTGTGKRTAPATTGVNREAKKGKKASEKVRRGEEEGEEEK